MKLKTSLLAVVWLAAGAAAHAGIIVDASGFTNGASTYSATGITFRSNVDAAGIGDASPEGVFQQKSQGGFTGVGIDSPGAADRTPGEIDAGATGSYEVLRGDFAVSSLIDSFRVTLLFDGPEYDDVQETAQVKVDGHTGRLVTVYTLAGTLAYWYLDANAPVLALNIAPATDGMGAVWQVDDPFAGAYTSFVSFSALPGACGTGPCTNQADYAFERIEFEPVPEPATMALLGSGLLALRLRRRRRR